MTLAQASYMCYTRSVLKAITTLSGVVVGFLGKMVYNRDTGPTSLSSGVWRPEHHLQYNSTHYEFVLIVNK